MHASNLRVACLQKIVVMLPFIRKDMLLKVLNDLLQCNDAASSRKEVIRDIVSSLDSLVWEREIRSRKQAKDSRIGIATTPKNSRKK